MTDQLADLIQRYYDAFNRRDLAIYDRLFTPDCLIEAPGLELRGVEAMRGFDQGWQVAMPDARITSLHKAVAGRIVMSENRIRGTHTGPLVTGEGTLPPSGRVFDRPYTTVFELAGERIQRQTLHYDRAQVMLDLGTPNYIERVQQIYAAFPRGDMQYILDQVADDVSWGIESVAAGEVAPYGLRTGKDGVAEFFAAWGATADFTSFEASEFVAAGAHVFNVLRYTLTVKATGKHVQSPACMQHWTFRGDKLVRWRGAEDTAATRDAFRK
jgi:hypothetical protein